MARDNRFFSRGSRAYQHASPRCVDQHLMVRRLRGVSQTSSTRLDTARTYPLNDTSNILELPFGTPPGKVQLPSQSPEMATNNHQLVPVLHRYTKPSRCGNHQEQQAESIAKHEYQVPLDTITQAMHLDSLLISQR